METLTFQPEFINGEGYCYRIKFLIYIKEHTLSIYFKLLEKRCNIKTF